MRISRAKIGGRSSTRFGPFLSQSGKLFRETIGGDSYVISKLFGNRTDIGSRRKFSRSKRASKPGGVFVVTAVALSQLRNGRINWKSLFVRPVKIARCA